MKKHLLFLFFGIIHIAGSAQINPSEKGFQTYQIKTINDTINFYIYNPKSIIKKHLFIHIDGSYPAPLWIETNPCCATLDPFNYDLIPEQYAYVVISKHGFPFSGKENFKTPKNFWKKNTLDFRVSRANQVIKYIQKNIFEPEEIVVVGTSQGTDIAAKLATINKDITKIGFWAGGGLPQLMEFIMFARKDAIAGKITEVEATKRIDSLLVQFEKMFDNPTPEKMWDGNSYLSYVSFSEPPVANLLKLDIPIYVAIGTKDENVAAENSYIIPVEFIRNRKKNLTFRQFPNYDHGFVEKTVKGKKIDRFDRVTKDFIKWLNEN
ncbi:alpha/beta hydrolase family protein [Winogradskyella luteola]|uniref:Dienelactone hydrolase family protein n=1 Tax=Winogradskyella luteola TaxID=2828330 RepID=A0A9X1FBL6_9FLAO|nr:dienelactone hydrolase family protein [Winogradskyella luteola]MBV7270719.1 dienelactone hydrolase family protein [Winogradskyella luteola]